MASASIVSTAEALTMLGLASTAKQADISLCNLLHRKVERLVKDECKSEIVYSTHVELLPPTGQFAPSEALIDGYEGASGRAMPIERYRAENRVIELYNKPVRSIISIYEYPDAGNTDPPTFPSSSLLLAGRDFQLDQKIAGWSTSGRLLRRTGVWTNVERCIQVTYTAGFTAAELEDPPVGIRTNHKLATLTALQIWFDQVRVWQAGMGNQPGPMTAEGLDGWTASYSEKAIANMSYFQVLPPSARLMLQNSVNYSAYI